MTRIYRIITQDCNDRALTVIDIVFKINLEKELYSSGSIASASFFYMDIILNIQNKTDSELFSVVKHLYHMLFISEEAKNEVIRLRSNAEVEPDGFVRISVDRGGCSGLSYRMDFDTEEKAGDQVFEDRGIKLVTDLKSLLYLFETTLDFSGGLNGKGFHFINPNASRECACGESFAV